MGVFQILFIALNLSLPVWLWTRSGKDKVTVDWPALEKTVMRLAESDEAFFPCSSMRVRDVIHDLCRESLGKFTDGESKSIESEGDHVVFSCEVKKDSVVIGWRFSDHKGRGNECGDPGGEIVERAPLFVFNLEGKMRAIEFWSKEQTHETLPYRNCKLKAAQLKGLQDGPSTLPEFLQRLVRVQKDPQDSMTANLLCFTYDSSPIWKTWRQKYEP